MVSYSTFYYQILLTTKTKKMSIEEWQVIEKEMRLVFEKDKTLTHIEVSFNIQPVKTEKKIARINIKTYKDEKRNT